MERYAIYEGNMDRVEKKLQRIANKCSKFGCSFTFNIVGEEFREVKSEVGQVETLRFVVVEAEGVAKLNDWRFIASVEHTGKGNIISKAAFDIEVPETYYFSKPFCEHCNTSKARKNTFIVMNEKTGEFKQVGRSCLADFTGGLSAEAVVQYYNWFEELVKGQSVDSGSGYTTYYKTSTILRYFAETVRKYGFVKKFDNEGLINGDATAVRGFDFYLLLEEGRVCGSKEKRKFLENEVIKVSFDAQSLGAMSDTVEAVAWIEGQGMDNNYIHNLKTVCSLDYVTYKQLGLLASLFAAWKRAVAKEEQQKAYESKTNEQKKNSNYIGEEKQRLTLNVTNFELVTSWMSDFGTTCLYKMVDEFDNVLIWKSSKWIEQPENVTAITGTVKAHSEFNGVKQTELTRCKVTV